MNKTVIQSTGRRKTSVARLRLVEGNRSFIVNTKSIEKYFPHLTLQKLLYQPFETVDVAPDYTITATVTGGGSHGQAEAIRLALSRALIELDPSYRPSLRSKGFLTRDARMVERKKYGRKKARKRFQFSKR